MIDLTTAPYAVLLLRLVMEQNGGDRSSRFHRS
jgi:hypothetical protein